MMCQIINLIVFVCFGLASALANTTPIHCTNDVSNLLYLSREKTLPKKCDANSTYILKCCPENEVVVHSKHNEEDSYSCLYIKNLKLDYSVIKIYHNESRLVGKVSTKQFKDFHIFYNNKFINNSKEYKLLDIQLEIVENGYFMTGDEKQDIYIAIEPFAYCADLSIDKDDKNKKLEPIILISESSRSNECMKFTQIGKMVSTGFLILAIFVTSVILGQYKKMSERLVLTYMFMLLFAYSFEIFAIKFISTFLLCNILTPITWFFLTSSFFWLNIMSFDLFWTFRGCRLSRNINRRGLNHKYMCYGIYAWGVPLVLLIAEVAIDEIPLNESIINKIKPYFMMCSKTPNNWSYEAFVILPMAILTILNCCLFLMTLYNIIRPFKNNIGAFKDSSKSNAQKSSFITVSKLSVMMGFSWILELIEKTSPTKVEEKCSWVVYLLDFYNSFIGVFIFLIFICNTTTYKTLHRRFIKDSKYNSSFKNTTVSSRLSSKKSRTSLTPREIQTE